MADTKPKVHYYRCRSASALSIILGGPQAGDVEPERLRFQPFQERWEGEAVKVGYLATDDRRAVDRLAKDPSVEEIDEDEYLLKTDTSEANDQAAKVVPLGL